MSDLSEITLGFLGCGKISSAVCRGFAGAPGNKRPKKIVVSRRSSDKSAALQAAFPDLIVVEDSNENIVAQADIIFIGLLPQVARDTLPQLNFGSEKLVISMMAAVDYQETLQLTRVTAERLVRTVPLPSAATRSGPVLVYPPNPKLESILSIVSTPAVCSEEAQMKPMIAITGHISSFFELMKTSQDFLVDEGTVGYFCMYLLGVKCFCFSSQGIENATARTFVTSFYSSLAQAAERSHEQLSDMAHEAATPGGLNEQSWRYLKGTDHFSLQTESLAAIHNRLLGKK